MSKSKFTEAQHESVGRRLSEVRNTLQTLYVEVSNAYPLQDKFVRTLEQALRAVNEAKSQGDDRAAREHPAEWKATWYYDGGTKE